MCNLQVDQHPGGGARIMLAAGGAIDPFWAMYAQHKTAEVRKILETYRIGDLVSTSRLRVTSSVACVTSATLLHMSGLKRSSNIIAVIGDKRAVSA